MTTLLDGRIVGVVVGLFAAGPARAGAHDRTVGRRLVATAPGGDGRTGDRGGVGRGHRYGDVAGSDLVTSTSATAPVRTVESIDLDHRS